jgi:salicylate biosynthesis isochorismate synthase
MQPLRDVLTRARARARQLGRPVLASHSMPVLPIDPLDILADDADGPRMYWASADRSCVMAGIGQATLVAPGGAQRFAEAGRAASQLFADAIAEPTAIGPVLMGGFAFHAEPEQAGAWRGFGPSRLTVPRLVVRRRGEDCVVTLTALVSFDTDVAIECAALEELRARIVSATPLAADALNIETSVTDTEPSVEWRALIRRAVDHIRAGRLEKVVLAREERAPLPDIDIVSAVRHLRNANPRAFIFAVWRDDAVFFGASPELLVRVTGRDVVTSVLAGSTRRGDSPAEDAALGQALTASSKDREEHAIVRRELEAALSAVCDGVQLNARPDLVTLPHVQHLHTAVRARLRDGYGGFDVLDRLHPTPAVGGAPREAALAFIREHEGVERGWYAAPVGWSDATRSEFAVALRCALVRDRTAHLFAGCGIVAQSDPDAEWEESQLKLRPAIEALSVGVIEAQGTATGKAT